MAASIQTSATFSSHSPNPGATTTPNLSLRRTIRRAELRKIVPLANTTIYEMERRGDFPRRFYLTPRCVVWDLEEVYAWVDARKQPDAQAKLGRAPMPNVRLRRRRPLKTSM